MKHPLTLFAALVATALLALTLASCRDTLPAGPHDTGNSDTIAYWTFDGNTNDVSGNGHDGSISGTTGFGKDRFGTPGTALILNRNTTVIVASISDLNMLTGNSYTISTWVNIADTGYGSTCKILSKMVTSRFAEETGYEIDRSFYNSKMQPVYAGLVDLSNQGTLALGNQDGLNWYSTSSPQWHMVTLVVAAHQTISLYVDSVLVQSAAIEIKDNVANNDVPLTMGPLADGSAVDDILMLHRAMSANEVTSRFHEGGWYAHQDTAIVPPPPDSGWSRKPGLSGTNQDLLVGQFVNSTVGFVGGSNGIFLKTTDAGSTWSLRSPVPVSGTVYGISFFSATNGFAVGDQRTIAATSDGGGTWATINTSNVPTSDLIRSVCFATQNTGFVGTADAYGAPSGTICRSIDGGLTWNPVITTQGGIYDIDFSIPGSNGMNGVALGRFGVSYWTNDGGATWNQGTTDQPNVIISHSTFTSATTGFAVATNITDTIRGFILRTDDAGHSWHTVRSSWIFGNCGIANNGNGVITAVGFGGAVVESTDGGSTWLGTTSGTSRWFAVQYPTPHRAVFVGMNGNIATRDR